MSKDFLALFSASRAASVLVPTIWIHNVAALKQVSDLLSLQFTFLALPKALAAVSALIASCFVWKRRRESESAIWLFLLLVGTAILSGTGAFELSSTVLANKIFWNQLCYIGVSLGSFSLFHFTYVYAYGTIPPRIVSWLTGGLGAVALLSAATNGFHHLQWQEVRLLDRDGLITALYVRGPMFWATVVYCYGTLFSSSVIMAMNTFTQAAVFRRQSALIFVSMLTPWAANAVYILRLGPYPEIDQTPVGFGIAGVVITWAMLRERLFEIVPVATQTLFTHMPDPVLVIDPHGRLVSVNPAATKHFNGLEKFVGSSALESFPNDTKIALALGLLLKTPHHETADQTLESNGVWWTIKSTSLDQENRRPRGQLIVLRDVTEQKRAAQKIEQSLAQADAANAAKSTFLAQVSHDLRTPLHAILGMTEVLRSSPLTDGQRTETGIINDAGEVLLRLINELLDLSRIEARRIDLSADAFLLDDVLDQIDDLLGPIARQKGLTFTYWIEPGLSASMRGDTDRLRQILFNLVGNAVKFTDRGEVILRASPGATPQTLRIEVQDTGAGIAPEHLPKLFEPFNRGSREVARRTEGTGLGLAITHRLAEAMGGTLTVESRVGKGTTFAVELPLIDPNAVTDSSADLAGKIQGRRVVVWIADFARRTAVIKGLSGLGAKVSEPGDAATPANGATLIIEEANEAAAPGVDVIRLAPAGSRPTDGTVLLRRRALAHALNGSTFDELKPKSLRKLAPCRVLLADDDDLSRQVTARQLAHCGCEVDTVNGGFPALERLRVRAFDIVFLDGQMPDLDGWEVVHRLRELPAGSANRDTPVVALTADLMADARQRWLAAGATVVVGKPVRTQVLLTTIERLVTR